MKGIAPWRQQHWDWRAAGNFVCGGSGAGVILMMPVMGAGVERVAVLIGLALIAAGLAMVWAELGRKLRFLNVFRHPQTSWMTREALAAVPLFASGLIAAWTTRQPLLWLAACFAFLFLYCQARMLHASKGIPAWRVSSSVPLLVSTGLAEGAAILLVARLSAPAGSGIEMLWLMAALLAMRAVCWDAYRQSLAGNAPQDTLAEIASMSPWQLWAGHVAPGLVLVVGLLLPGLATVAGALAGLLVIQGGWHMKFAIVVRAAYNQGYALPVTPDRGLSGSRVGVKPGWPQSPQQRAREILIRKQGRT